VHGNTHTRTYTHACKNIIHPHDYSFVLLKIKKHDRNLMIPKRRKRHGGETTAKSDKEIEKL
jgi:hypothetical protein